MVVAIQAILELLASFFCGVNRVNPFAGWAKNSGQYFLWGAHRHKVYHIDMKGLAALFLLLFCHALWASGSGEVGLFVVDRDDSSQTHTTSGLPIARYYGGAGAVIGGDFNLILGLSLHGTVEFSSGGAMVEYDNLNPNLNRARMSRLSADLGFLAGRLGMRLRPLFGEKFNVVAGAGILGGSMSLSYERSEYQAANQQNDTGFEDGDAAGAYGVYYEAGLEWLATEYGVRVMLQQDRISSEKFKTLNNTKLKFTFNRAMLLLAQRF